MVEIDLASQDSFPLRMTSPTPIAPPSCSETASPNWQIELLYDGECPLCLREVHFLRQKDAGRGIVSFVDIADLAYDPEQHGGIDFETAMGRIHALLPDGSVIRDVEVFRRVYAALGMGWVYAATKWPLVGPLVDRIYDIWAHKRLAIAGRPDLETVVADRQRRLEDCGNGDRCKVPST